MSAAVEKLSEIERKIVIVIPAKEVDAGVEAEFVKVSKTAHVDGFRPGKVPVSVLKKRYMAGVRFQVLENLIPKHLEMVVTANKVSPVGMPHIEFIKNEAGQDVEFSAVFDIYPEVTIKGLDAIKLEKTNATVTEANVDQMMETLRKQQATWKEVQRAAGDDDRVIIDFDGEMEGKPFEGGSAKEVPLVLGSKQMIEGFEAGLLGVKAGDSRELNLTFPTSYFVKELAGKPVKFKVHVKSVTEAELPVLDQAFADKFKVNSIEALRKEIRNNMERELEFTLKNRFKMQLMDALLKDNQFAVPKSLVAQEIEHLKQQALHQMGMRDVKNNKNLQLPDQLFEAEAKRRVQLGILMHKVVEQHQLKANEQRVKEVLQKMASVYEEPEQAVAQYMQDKQQVAQIEQAVLEDMVVEKLCESIALTIIEKGFYDVMGAQAGAR